jgi:hypothetical protein
MPVHVFRTLLTRAAVFIFHFVENSVMFYFVTH